MRLGTDLATGRLDQLLDDGQADAGPAARPIARLLDPVEAFEDPLEIGGRDPSPVLVIETRRSAACRSARTVTVPPAGV